MINNRLVDFAVIELFDVFRFIADRDGINRGPARVAGETRFVANPAAIGEREGILGAENYALRLIGIDDPGPAGVEIGRQKIRARQWIIHKGLIERRQFGEDRVPHPPRRRHRRRHRQVAG